MGDPRASGPAERGQALPLFLIVFVALLGFAGLAIDGSRLFAEHSRLQSAADAAAIGAAHELRRGNHEYSANLLPAAIHDAGLHGITVEQAEIIVHHPPVSGAFAESPDHVEVVVRSQLPATFMAMFGVGRRPVSGRAVAGLVTAEPPCLVALAEGEANTFTVEGEQPFETDCAVQSAAATDPFAGLRMPSCVGRQPASIEEPSEGGAVSYWPGCYEDAVAIRSGRVQLMPGVHIFKRGLEIAGGEVTGQDVSLLFPASGEQTGISIGTGARVALSAPLRGELPGMLLFAEAGGAAGDATVARGAGSDLLGAFYFPGRTLRLAPNAPGSESWIQAVAGRIAVLEGPGGRAVIAPPVDAASGSTVALVE